MARPQPHAARLGDSCCNGDLGGLGAVFATTGTHRGGVHEVGRAIGHIAGLVADAHIVGPWGHIEDEGAVGASAGRSKGLARGEIAEGDLHAGEGHIGWIGHACEAPRQPSTRYQGEVLGNHGIAHSDLPGLELAGGGPSSGPPATGGEAGGAQVHGTDNIVASGHTDRIGAIHGGLRDAHEGEAAKAADPYANPCQGLTRQVLHGAGDAEGGGQVGQGVLRFFILRHGGLKGRQHGGGCDCRAGDVAHVAVHGSLNGENSAVA